MVHQAWCSFESQDMGISWRWVSSFIARKLHSWEQLEMIEGKSKGKKMRERERGRKRKSQFVCVDKDWGEISNVLLELD